MTDRDRISIRQLNRLRRRILRVYGTARREMQKQLTEFLAKYKALDERKRAQLDAGEITEDDYRIWLQNQVFQSDLMRAKLDGITQTCTTAQETAYKLARDEQYNIFSFGANWAFYELEQANRYVMQGIVQGKSVHDIAVQAVNGMADTEIHWAMNNAITALTGAQNAGALQQMRNAKALGIEVKKRWNSTHDYRTREMHRLLDQQTAELDEPFKVMGYEIQRPGDPNAAPEMVYHCRCVLSSALGKYPRQNAMQRDNVTKETTPVMDYTEWYKSKGGKEAEQMWWAEERKRRKENGK